MQHTVAERIEILIAMKEQKKHASALNIAKWSVEDWALKLNIPRATLYGYIEAEEELFSADVAPDSKRATLPGKPAPTKQLEVSVAQLVRRRCQENNKMTKKDVIEHSVRSIAVVAAKTPKAQLSWVNRFIRRNRLVGYIALYPKQSTQSRPIPAIVTTKPQETMGVCGDNSLSTLANLCATKSEAAEISLDTLDDTKEDQQLGNQQCPILIDSDGDDDSLTDKVVPTISVVCTTLTRSFRSGDSEYKKLSVDEQDLKTLDSKVWLNGFVASYFIRAFIKADSFTYNFDTQLFGVLLGKKWECGEITTDDYTAQFPYETFKTILIPVCLDNHWSFLVMQNPVLAFKGLKPCMLHVDSYQYHDTAKIKKIVCGYFQQEAMEKYKVKKVTYTVRGLSTNPPQRNGYDCGIFMLYFMRKVNQALCLANGNLDLLHTIDDICTITERRFNCDLERMNFMKLFRNEQVVQQNHI